MTPKRNTNYLGLGIFIGGWLLMGYVLWLAVIVAGGHPTKLFNWPILALASFLGPDHHQIIPWHWVGASRVAQPLKFWEVIFGFLTLVALVMVYFIAVSRGYLPRPSLLRRIPQSSRWGRMWDYDIQRLIVRQAGQPGRVTLGWKGPALLATEACASTLVFGPTQSGKTSGICVPAILEWQGPVLAISIKRDLVDQTAGWRQRKGRTLIYDPSGVTGLPCMRWSPHYVCAEFEVAWKMANWISSVIDRGKSRGDSDWGHWRDAAQRLIAVSFYAGARLGATMAEVRAWVNDGSGESLRHALSLVPDCDPTAIETFQSVQNRAERERSSCYSTTQRTLSVFIERKVAESASGNEYDTTEFLLDGENTLYLVAPLADQDRLVILFTSLIIFTCERAAEIAQGSPAGRLPHSLLLVLDELANTAPIEQLPKYLATGFQQGITVIAIFQDLSQVRDRYLELSESIVNNSRAKLFLSGIADLQTLQLASQLTGQEKYRSHTYSTGEGPGQYNYQYRNLAAPDVARQLRPGSALLIYHFLRPSVLALRPWFRNSMLKHRAGVPFIPGATRVVA
jgi:type IV secretion system protein VirD4